MFDDIVDRYDLLSDVLSMGFDRSWRRRTAAALGTPEGSWVLDAGCGTGALGRRLAGRYRVVGVDVSAEMVRAARRRMGSTMRLLQGSVFRLPFADGAFGGVVSAFVLRNLEDLQAAFTELARVVRPGGGLAIVDITEPRGRAWRRAFDAYFAVAAPLVGRFSKNPDVYRYLARSLPQLPPPERVSAMLDEAGFGDVRDRSLAPGMVTLWTARRMGNSG
jgi:demethylmenaquinone methyltransferase/2-methoxy-6-polyprenyl-1,4-benzoquinol methylase